MTKLTQGLEAGDHFGAVLAEVGRLLLGRGGVALAAVAAHAEQERFPTARHDDAVALEPRRPLFQRERDRLGMDEAGEPTAQEQQPLEAHERGPHARPVGAHRFQARAKALKLRS